MNLLDELKNNPFLLAPMAGITDRPFRSFMREMGCGILTTELVSANGLQFSSEKTKRLMQFDEIQHPVGVQIFGERLDALSEAAQFVEQLGADFVDLNFGCPVPKVVKKGAGSAILKDLVQMGKVLKATKSAVSIPVTIKVRTGWDDQSRNTHDVVKVAYNEGITWVAVHGRTRAQAYTGLADWDYIKQIKETSPIPVIGNGDIVSAKWAVDRLQQSGCDGVMIGRGCLKNPWIFKESLELLLNQGLSDQSRGKKDFGQFFKRLRYHLENHFEEKICVLQVKKLAAWFSSGYPESAKFRKQIFSIQEKFELYETVDSFFERLAHVAQIDTSHEPFLMGGHG